MDSSPSPSQSSTSNSSHPAPPSSTKTSSTSPMSLPLQPPFPPQPPHPSAPPSHPDLGEWMSDLGLHSLGLAPPAPAAASQGAGGGGSDMMDFTPASAASWGMSLPGGPLNAGVASMLQSFNASTGAGAGGNGRYPMGFPQQTQQQQPQRFTYPHPPNQLASTSTNPTLSGLPPARVVKRPTPVARKSGGSASTGTGAVPRPSAGGASSQDEAGRRERERGVVLEGEVDTRGWGVVQLGRGECEKLPILIRGIKPSGAKSRVETQIKMRISILRPSSTYESAVAALPAFRRTKEGEPTPMEVLTPPTSVILGGGKSVGSRNSSISGAGGLRGSLSPISNEESSPERGWLNQAGPSGGGGVVLTGPAPYDKVSTYKYLKLQKGVGMKRRGRKTGDLGDEVGEGREEETLWLQTEVYCSEGGGRAYACVKCRSRELKRNQTKVSQRVRPSASDSDDPPSLPHPHKSSSTITDGSDLTPSQAHKMGLDPTQPPPAPAWDPDMEDERHKIMVFNCGPLMELVDGECELPGRVTCYCRHHKEKVGFKIVLNLRDHTGRIVATGTTPPIMITDDHKTSGRVTGTSAAGMSTDGGLSASTSRSKASVTSAKSERGKKSRESSAATEDSVAAAGRQAKTKPYDRKPSGASETKSNPGGNGAMSPRGSFNPHGLSMTPLTGRSVPSSPAVSTANRGGYFSPPTVTMPIQPGSGAITPSLLQGPGPAFNGMEYPSRPSSPQALAEALPAVADQLSAWAENGAQQNQRELDASYGLMMETNPAQFNGMQVDEEQWGYSDPTAANGGGLMEQNGLMNQNGFMDFDIAPPNFPDMSGFPQNGMYFDAGFGMEGQQQNNAPPKTYPQQALRQNMEVDQDFSSMINFSPTTGHLQLPAASPASASTSEQYQSPGSSVSNPYSNANYPSPGYQDIPRSLSQPAQPMQQQVSPPQPPRPMITRLVPAEGPTHGGIEVTVLGENFTPGIVVSFGNFAAVTVQSYGPTTLVCLLPPSPMPGPVAVHVTAMQANGLPNAAGSSDVTVPSATFTYQDVSDRKLMEMALTAVGLRVTGKMVGAVEIARRIMSAPQAADGSAGQISQQGQQQLLSTQAPALPSVTTEDDLAQQLARSVYSRSTKDFQSAILQFLSVFVNDATRYRGTSSSGKRHRNDSASAINHVNNEGQTILHLAAFMGFEQVVRLLLKSDATVDIHDRNGYTALGFACLGGRVGCVKILLGAGARRAACTFSGETAEGIAGKLKAHSIIRILEAAKQAESRASGHKRRVSTSESSLDGDNPSTDDGFSSGRLSEDLDTGVRADGTDLLSPRRLTRPEDIRSPPPNILESPELAKSDGTVTPTMPTASAAAPTTLTLPSPAPTSESDDPPPYATLDAASWIHRALQSNIPAPLQAYIPDAVWDKVSSGAAQAQVMIPNLGMGGTMFGQGMEGDGWGGAWLAVPLGAWMNAMPKAERVEGGVEAKAEEVEVEVEAGPSGTTGAGEVVLVKEGELKRRHGRKGSGEGRPKLGRRKGSGEVGGKVRVEKRIVGGDKQPDRMLFLFWLPILMLAFAYTFITTVPLVVGRVIFWPLLKIIGVVL